jgi:serine/threonine protein kinase
MGAVYLANRKVDGVAVALKVLLAQVAVSPLARASFLREIDVTRTLEHRSIVRLFDYGALESELFYFVMELCAKGSVDQLLARRGGRLTIGETLDLALPALEGLAYAHQRGFVHRDIKPQNILLADDAGAKLSDFGLAKSFAKAGLSGMTTTGATGAGTPLFMPREQLINYKFVRPVSDVWSFGATLYYVLSGTSPRDFAKDVDPLSVILGGGFVPIRSRDPAIPRGVAAVIDRALADDADARYPSATELLDALRALR